ncbi:hypothetical protein OH77DRAFT_1434553 [Trametes cingulata]|nr:hypothetical protein OH77DRAFT_1434553 [Trametes cingulata]
MAATHTVAPHDVPTTFNYYLATDGGAEAPYQYALLDPPAGKPASNIGEDEHQVVVHDARGRESEFTLDTTGFQFVTWPTKVNDFYNDERIRAEYYPEVEELLKKVAGAKRIFIFDHIVRRSAKKETGEAGPENRGPVEHVHVDQTYEAGPARVKYHLPEDAPRLLESRVRIINVWRPIRNPVAHKPLAVGDWRSLDPERDLVPVRLIMPHREGRTFGVRYNPDHRFYYLSGQTPDEVTLIKCYDSETDKARLAPHTAFLDSTSPKDAPHRQSIEIRALVFDAE